MKRFISVNQKGGVGKTFTSFSAVHYLADEGNRVLAVDGDEQANLSTTLSDYGTHGITASQLFSSQPLVLPTSGQRITALLADKEGLRRVEHSNMDDAELVANLRARLDELAPHFDYAVFDTPGSNSRVANALLVASDYAVVPCKVDQDSVTVSIEVLKRIYLVQQKWNPDLVSLGILVNEYDRRQPAQVKAWDEMRTNIAQYMLPFFISDRSAYREARAAGVPVWKLKGDDGDQHGPMKSAVREASKELRLVFKLLLEKVEVTA